ncbi:MAG: NADH:flavin oxidoreductase/NADH oxidase [Bdellovibrionales bacterium]
MPSKLFSPLSLRGVTFKNRVFVSPMDQYSGQDGVPNAWHFVHLGSRAVGGAGCVIQEATAISPEGRISPGDLGIWNDVQRDAMRPITQFIKDNGAIPGIQIGHGGRKSCTAAPWLGGATVSEAEGGWRPVLAPSPIPFSPDSLMPKEMTAQDIVKVIEDFRNAARRSVEAGYQAIELHAAHGYLLHEFLSPLSNQRTDSYGGSLENRMRLALEICAVVRSAMPDNLPLFVRLSATDWVEGGWDVAQTIELVKQLRTLGADLIDTSSGGLVYNAKVPSGPGYQVPFSAQVRKETGMPTSTVGVITAPMQAEQIVATGQADVVMLARELLRNPYWPLHAANTLGANVDWPLPYERAKAH